MRLSIAIVSNGRPDALRRAFLSLCQQDLVGFEVIVVADKSGLSALSPWADRIKQVHFETANIAQARNIALAHAAGDVIAFIDDDAVAEPTWARRLLVPFADETVVAAAGFVRGRDGLSWQWRGEQIDALAREYPTSTPPQTHEDRALKTIGTNCAFRTHVLREIGGFDPAYHYYLDESDVNFRLRMRGTTVLIPDAVVHHGVLPSRHRHPNRAPQSLFDVGASTAVYLRRHAPHALDEGRAIMCEMHRKRLSAHRNAGRLTAPQMQALERSLNDGWTAGLERRLTEYAPLSHTPPSFKAMPQTGPRPGQIILQTPYADRNRAKERVQEGYIVTVFALSIGIARQKHCFTDDGFWVHSGGIWGRSGQRKPPRIFWTHQQRATHEAQELSHYRPMF